MRLDGFVEYISNTLINSDCIDPSIPIYKGVNPFLCLTQTPTTPTVWVLPADYQYQFEGQRATRHKMRWQPVVAILVAKKLTQVSTLSDIANYDEVVPVLEATQDCAEVVAALPEIGNMEVRLALEIPLELRVHATIIQAIFKDSTCLPSDKTCGSSS